MRAEMEGRKEGRKDERKGGRKIKWSDGKRVEELTESHSPMS
jgi:hypothetical protein